MKLVPDVSRRRIQALATGDTKRVKSCVVLGRLLIDRPELIAWRDGPRKRGPKPKESQEGKSPEGKASKAQSSNGKGKRRSPSSG
jgi:hypothetical protein